MAIGIVSGLFGAVFGVGGGIIIVPLLIMLLAYDARAATATSLAAIVLTAAAGAAAHGALGNVDLATALMLGVPGAAGAAIGVAAKARMSSRNLQLAFAALLALVAVRMLFG